MKNILGNSKFRFTKWCVGLRTSLLLALTVGWMGMAQAQTSPTAQNLPFSVNFGSASFTSLPAGVAVWNGVSGAALSSQATAAASTPTGNATLTGATAAQTSGGAYGYAAGGDGKLYIQTSSNTSNGANQPVIAIVATGASNITLSYTVDVISAQPRTIGVVAQYRVGTSGAWTTLSASSGSNPFSQAGGTAGLKTTVTAILPSAADNQAEVQIRWAIWRGTETGNSSGIAIDNISLVSSGGGGTGPTVSGFSPSSGAVGSSVTISGSNFGSSPVVKFNGTTATSSVNAGGTQITATVPAGASSGKITVEVAGQTAATSATDFTVVAVGAPLVAVSPTSATGLTNYVGQVSASTNYTVTGTNLVSDLVVTASTNAIEVSTNSSTGFTNSFSLAPSGSGTLSNTVYVRISALAPAGAVSATVSNVSGVASNNFTVSGTVTQPALTLVLATNSVAENAGANATTGTVGIPAVLSSNLVVSLVSSNTAAATVPASVTITNGTTNAIFDIAAVANTNSYAGATAVITASVTNYTPASATLTVQNVDAAPVSTISLTSLATESYTQSFDALGTASIPSAISFTAGVQTSLAAVTGSSTLNGWYATKVGGSSSAATAITAEAGGGTSGLVYSYGAASASDRALGMLASGSSWMAIGALIKNDTGATINSIKVSFTAEFWRSSTSVQNILTCAIGKVDGSTITTANFLTEPSAIPLVRANITGPSPVSSNGLLDGNAVANQVAFIDVVIPLVLAAGETGFVRWSDVNDAGNDAGLAIDNLRMTASLDLPAADGDGAVSLANSTVSSPYTLSGIWAAGGTAQGVSVNVTPLLESTTLTSVSILVPADFGAPLVENVTSSGGATGGTPTVVGQLITLNGVSITKANPGVVNIAGLSTPATGTIGAGNGVYPFTVSTAGDGGTLKAVFVSPAANVLIPIVNIRDIDANGAPVDKNTIVAVEGVCTTGPLGGTSFIQDASYGIAIYPATTNPAFTLGMVAGRRYAVVGTLVDYNGMAEIKPASVSGVVDLGVDTMPAPISITVAQAKAEQYESMLVTIADLTKDTAETDPWAVSKTITVKNSAGDAIDVRIQSESTATPEPVYPVTITGILAQFSSATPRALTYQIMPRTGSDLSFAPGLKLAWSVAPAVILENGAGFDPSSIFLTVSRVGSSAGTAAVELSISPAGRMINDGSALPQTINFAAGETSKVLSLTPVDDSVYTGDTVVTITATDKAGVLTVASATAQILEDETSAPSDTTAPVITLVGAATITLDWGSAYSDAGATATDNLDSSVTVNSSGTVNTAKPGVYTISYTASDAANNSAAPVVRTVIVSAPSTTPGADGVSGLLRYAFGANGPNDSVTKPTTVLIDGNLVLTAIVRVDNAKLTVAGESVTDLVNYASGTAITTVNGSSAGVDQTGVPAGCERQTFTVAQGGGLKKFLRLIATLAP